jgi:hypothetical protein
MAPCVLHAAGAPTYIGSAEMHDKVQMKSSFGVGTEGMGSWKEATLILCAEWGIPGKRAG